MDEAEVADRIGIIDYSRIVALDTPDHHLKDSMGGDVITLEANNNEAAAAELTQRFNVDPLNENGVLSFSVPHGDKFLPRLIRNLESPIVSVGLRRPALEDAFLRLTGHAIRQQEADGMAEAPGSHVAPQSGEIAHDRGSCRNPRGRLQGTASLCPGEVTPRILICHAITVSRHLRRRIHPDHRTMAPGVDFVQFIYAGIIAMTVLMNSVVSGLSVVWDREFGFLKEIPMAPIARSGIMLGKAAGAAMVAVMQGSILLVLAPLVGVSLTPLLVIKLIPLLVVISVSLSGMGLLVASRMRSQQGFQLVVQLIIFPLIFLSGVFFPVNNVPTWLEIASKLNPLTYAVDAVRQLFLAGHGNAAIGVTVFGHTMTVLQDVLVVAVFGFALLLSATWSFEKQE